jgi:hypothetical protein
MKYPNLRARGYNDAFAHQHPGTDLSKMSFDAVRDLAKSQSGSSAIGRYQFMSYTLDGLKKELGLKGDEPFTPALQDRLAKRLLQRRGYDQWKSGKLGDQAFMHNLSQEWAGLTDPNTGHGFYPGQTTGHSLKEQFSALKAERDAAYKTPHAIAGTGDHSVVPTAFSMPHRPTSVFHGVTSSEYPESKEKSVRELTSWRGLDKNAARMMASNWGGDTVHHHYDNSDNSMTYHDNRKTNVTVTGANEPHEVAAAVGSTLDKAFSPSQAKQRFLQGAIS